MIRLILIRSLVFWLIPIGWIFVLPLSYLIDGDFKRQVLDMRGFTDNLWSGECFD